MAESLREKLYKETQAAIKHLEAGNPIPENLIQTMRKDPRFKDLTVSKGGDKDFIEIQEVVLGSKSKQAQKYADEIDAEMWDASRDAVDSLTGEKELIKRLNIGQKDAIKEFERRKLVDKKGTGEKILEGKVVDEKVELFAFMDTLPKEMQHKIAFLPIDQQLPLLKRFKKAFDAYKAGDVEAGLDVLHKQLLEDFPIPKGKPHATGGLISGFATGGVSNLFRQRYRGGKAVELLTKLPEYIKFVERLWIKASNEIRQGLGKWKGLTQAQRVVQHDNMVKKMTEWQKTKILPEGSEQYFAIDAEKAFIEAQAKVKKPYRESKLAEKVSQEHPSRKGEWEVEMGEREIDYDHLIKKKIKAVKSEKTRTMDDLVERAYDEIAGGSGFSGDIKYDADILASEIATTGGRIYDDLSDLERMGIYDLAYNRMAKNLKAKMDFKKNLKDIEQKIELQMFDPKDRKPQATGGLIPGYATGGVSNLFRSR
jgi:hypothetical protein